MSDHDEAHLFDGRDQDPSDMFDGPDDEGQPGAWFIADFDISECSRGGETIKQGSTVRADGASGYECRECYISDEDVDERIIARQMIRSGELRKVYDDGDEPSFGYWETGDYR